MGSDQDKTQVLDLIQRIMKATENGVLADEEAGAKALGFKMSTKNDQFNIPRQQIESGIPILDKNPTKEHVKYRANRRPQYWAVRLEKIDRLICIQRDEIHALFGEKWLIATPPHGAVHLSGMETIETVNDVGRRTATFWYAREAGEGVCMESFHNRFVSHNRSIDNQ